MSKRGRTDDIDDTTPDDPATASDAGHAGSAGKAIGGPRVGVLGPLEVWVGQRRVVVSTGRLRTLLVTLAMSAGEHVSMDRLATAMWGPDDDPPHDVRRTVQTYLTRLRALLGTGSIGTRPAGYVLRTAPDQVDALRFDRLLDDAGTAGDARTERIRLDEALALWRGDPFDGISSAWLKRSESPRLVERYLAAVERRVDLDLADGLHDDLVAGLRALTARHPLRETLWVRLLTVLHRSGRQAEALDRYESVRTLLAEELGTDPGPELRQVHADLLAGRAPAPRSDQSSPRWAVPRQLPADIAAFTGRTALLRQLDALLPTEPAAESAPVTVVVVHGTAGVGKTTLTIRWAHQVSGRFPDGQLYVNLRGFDPSGSAPSTTEVVRGFLDALGVPQQQIPPGLDAQLGRYRSVLADRRVLIVLDNARDADQVRPLLPGSSGCHVVVTSRNQLPGLVAVGGAHPLRVDLLGSDESRDLLVGRLGPARVSADVPAIDEIITRCAGLPLALAVVAARAATQPTFPVAVLANQLREARHHLDAFAADDAAIDVRAVFSWSYQALTPDAAGLFRQLGVQPGPDLTARAAASLAGRPLVEVRPLLAELARAHLIAEHVPGRYTCHDLLLAYATELAHAYDGATDRRAALRRVLDHYLHTAHAAAQLLDPHRLPIDLDRPAPGVLLGELSGQRAAVDWLGAEHAVLLAAIHRATEDGFEAYAWRLAGALVEFLARRGRWHDFLAIQRIAVTAAERLHDQVGQAHAYHGLGRANGKLDDYDQAQACYLRALDLFAAIEDHAGQASAHLGIGWLLGRQDRYRDAIRHARRADALYQAGGIEAGQANARNAIGWYHARLGDPRQALTHCQAALALHARLADRQGEANTWDSVGYAHQQLGQHTLAANCYDRAVRLYQEAGDRYGEAETLTRLGDIQQAVGDSDASRTSWQRAMTILDDLDHPDAGQLCARLHRLRPVGWRLAAAGTAR